MVCFQALQGPGEGKEGKDHSGRCWWSCAIGRNGVGCRKEIIQGSPLGGHTELQGTLEQQVQELEACTARACQQAPSDLHA